MQFLLLLLCLSAAYAVVWCLSQYTFVYCVEIIAKDTAIVQWNTNSSTIFNDLERPLTNFDFKVMPLFDAECLRNSTRWRYSYSGIQLGPYTRPT